jgi:hypothetical protein
MDVEKKNNLIITKMFTVHTTELSNGGLNWGLFNCWTLNFRKTLASHNSFSNQAFVKSRDVKREQWTTSSVTAILNLFQYRMCRSLKRGTC